MPQYRYAVNALMELPAFGKYAAGGRATRNGEICAESPLSERELKAAIAQSVADKNGCDVNGVAFVEFVFTDLSVA